MRSPPYLDFCIRLREAVLLVRVAKRSNEPVMATACSKSAAVLVAAALERYVNDALDLACRSIDVEAWDELPTGVQSFLVAQIARRLREATKSIQSPVDAMKGPAGSRVRAAVRDASQAFDNPSSWRHLPQFGMFMDGAALPDRLNGLLRDFRPDGKQLFERLQERGLDRGVFGRSLTDLIDTRHAAAHAIPDRSPPSPNDVSAWVSITFRLVREIEVYLRGPLYVTESHGPQRIGSDLAVP